MPEPVAPLRIAVLADDLIWADRLARAITAAGGAPVRFASPGAVAATAGLDGAIVDLTARAYDGVAAVAAMRREGLRVLAVGQHDDHALRRAALAAGSERVYAYRKLFEDGPGVIGAWLATAPSRTGSRPR